MRSRAPYRRGLALSIASFLLIDGRDGISSPFHGAALHLPSEAKEAASGIVEPGEFHFHHEGVLGTSFDLVVRADHRTAAAQAEQVALGEIERLRRILSAYDPASEMSRLNAADGPMNCSPELFEVLSAYDSWTTRSRGAYNGQLGELIQTWRAAEKLGAPPGEAALAKIVHSLSRPGWTMNAGDRTVTRLTAQRLNVDSLGKGYIISRAAAAARAAVPALSGFLLNIGGDIFACGQGAPDRPWRVGVADPNAPADNAPPLTQVLLADRAISTSAAYERGYTVAGRRYSHILDPRTGFPAEGAASATVVAADNATANALATTLCVLDPEEGLALVNATPGAECLIIAADGAQYRSAQFVALEVPASGEAKTANEAKPSLWPQEFQMTLTLTLKGPNAGGGGYRRPYVAIWVENERRVRVRTIAVWGNKQRYFPDLYDWSYGEKDRLDWAATIARATRPPGRHRVVWNGRDDSGHPVPRGTYTVSLEANREHGTYAKESGKIVCGDSPAGGLIKAGSEFEEAQLAYGPPSAE